MDVMVIKRDGSKEPYEEDKIAKVTHAASLTEQQAKKLGKTITSWIKKRKVKEISSLEIRDQVQEELKKVDNYAANMYGWYQNTKNGKLTQ